MRLANDAIYTTFIVGCLRFLHHSFEDLNGRRVHSFESIHVAVVSLLCTCPFLRVLLMSLSANVIRYHYTKLIAAGYIDSFEDLNQRKS